MGTGKREGRAPKLGWEQGWEAPATDRGKQSYTKHVEDGSLKKRKSSLDQMDDEGPRKVKKNKGSGLAALDKEGRQFNMHKVVVNMANVGATYSKKVLGKKDGDRLFDWEGVRRCCRFLKNEKKYSVVGVLNENFKGPDNGSRQMLEIPGDIRKMLESFEETPRIVGQNHSSADDEMTIKCAYRRNCRFLDNDNYRDWTQQLRDPKVRDWLNAYQGLLHVRYFFDSGEGFFDVLEGNVPEYMLAEGVIPDKKVLWTAKRG